MMINNQLIHRISAFIIGWTIACSSTIAAETPALDPQLRGKAETALKRGISWLLCQQGDDGLWHSATYGQMRGGAGTTALAVYSLANAWPLLMAEEQTQVRRGIKALTENLDPAGFVRVSDGSSDYPNYATALTILAIERAKLTEFDSQLKRMRQYLVEVQHPSGGWGQTGGDPADTASLHQPNISVTRYALEALRGSRDRDPQAIQRGIEFVSRLQQSDPDSPDRGSFHFTFPTDDPLNKAGTYRDSHGESRARGYGSATTDGVSALVAAGVPHDDPRVQSAFHWLEKFDDLKTVPGIPSDDPELAPNRQALLFYYYAALADVIKQSQSAQLSKRTAPLVEQILSLQKPGGQWANLSNLMREDDPLVATPLTIEALATLLTAENR